MNNSDYVVWYAELDKLDLKDPWVKKWWMQQVLLHGRIEDIGKLNFDEVRKLLPLDLRSPKRFIWELGLITLLILPQINFCVSLVSY